MAKPREPIQVAGAVSFVPGFNPRAFHSSVNKEVVGKISEPAKGYEN